VTKSEQIKMLEAELKAERLEREKAEAKLNEYKKREERFAFVESEGATYDGYRYKERLLVYAQPAPYGAGVFGPEGFHKALGQFIAKWNIAASNACQINEVEAKKKGGAK
jgi:hypothetical protein